MPQMSRPLELPLVGQGEARSPERSVEAPTASPPPDDPGASGLLESALADDNVQEAIRRVRKNKGGPGIDGMTVDELSTWRREHWPRVREELLAGTYQPQPVKRQSIPKPGGGERVLGIPTVQDRVIQQALLRVLQPLFDPSFSESSFGFRPGRGAHDAIRRACQHIQEGRRWVVDVDLAKFFDQVDHDVLMGRLARRGADKPTLGLIRRYSRAGMATGDLVVEREAGTPQGGPLSPLLANVLLDEVDKELEKRGHAFARYADDCNVFVRSQRAGERVMAWMRRLFANLKLQVNEAKSAVDRVWRRTFLGFSFWVDRDKRVRPRVAGKAIKRFKEKIRRLTRRTCGRSLEQVVETLQSTLRGWIGDFGIAGTKSVFVKLDKWIRHRLRAILLRPWRQGRTAYREVIKRGVDSLVATKTARQIRRWWHTSHRLMNQVVPIAVFDGMGLPRLAA